MEINNFDLVKSYKFCLISRHGQSFAIIPINDLFLVLDSHVHTIKLMNYNNISKYIKYQIGNTIDTTAHLHITILCCQ